MTNSRTKKANKNNKFNKAAKISKNLIFTYSAIEQKRHNIASPGKCLIIFLGIFPFMPLLLNLYSCFVKKIDYSMYKRLLMIGTLLMAVVMFVEIFVWIDRIFHVYMIDDQGNLYRLRISNFWYKIKDQTYLLGPMGMSGGKLMSMYYMIGNIKKVLENISDTITYDELISMGKLERLDHITEVKIRSKSISFNTDILNKSNKRVHIGRVYENDRQLIQFLKKEDYSEPEKLSDIWMEIKTSDTQYKKVIRFTLTWTTLAVWATVIILGGDFAKLARINAGEYVKTTIQEENTGEEIEVYMSVEDEKDYFNTSDFGRLFKPVAVIYGAVEIIYLINAGADVLVKVMKNKQEKE